MRVDVVVGSQLRFYARNRNETADADVQSVGYLGNIQVNVFERGIEAVLAVVVEPLRAEIAQVGSETIAGAIQSGEVESPIEVIRLNRVRKTFDVQDSLVELDSIREDII